MQNTKRWLASILAIALAFGDCGGMAAFAAENTVSENSIVSETETEQSDNDAASADMTAETTQNEDNEIPTDSSAGTTDAEETDGAAFIPESRQWLLA
ncbi:MAG: hypothetical protein NC302_00625, partial [Bacteroidales bacterium]|nr:hypothetical protein [Bacteroidales bacterium]